MSFNELAITITAENMASAEFNKVASDAAAMGNAVGASAGGFENLKTQAEATTVSLRTVAAAFSSVASMGSAMVSLAGDLGIVDKETAKWARTVLAVITLVTAWIRLKHYLITLTAGHTAAVAVNTTTQTANASSSLAVAAAHKIKATATWIAVSAQNALNISHATFLALTGVGIGVIIAAAAAMAYFASQMNAATSSVKEYNAAVGEMPTATHVPSIRRAGEEELYRRGVE